MARLSLSLTGPLPRNEELVAATRELDRGRRTAEEVRNLYDRATREVVELETSREFAAVTGGFLQWADLFRPFTQRIPGLRAGPLTRWFETNTFFRRPIFTEPPVSDGGVLADALPLDILRESPLPRKVLLPGPYTLSGLAENETDLSRGDLARAWAGVLAREVSALARWGYTHVQIQEPLLVVDPPSLEKENEVVAAYAPLASALEGVQSLVWTFYGDAAPVLPLLAKLPVQGFGIDLSETDPARIRAFPPGRVLGLGCLDSRTSLPEDPLEIARLVRELEGRLHPAGIHLGASAPLDLLPWETAKAKLEVLVAARRILASTGPSAHASSRAPSRPRVRAPTPPARARRRAARTPRRAPSTSRSRHGTRASRTTPRHRTSRRRVS